MQLDRALVKSQAKQLMSGRTINLFIITMILGFIMSAFSTTTNVYQINKDDFGGYPNWEYYEDNDDRDSDNPIDNFGNELFDEGFFDGITGSVTNVAMPFSASGIIGTGLGNLFLNTSKIITVFLAPLEIGIALLYLRLSRNQFDGFGKELDNSFKAAFNKNYFKNVLLLFVRRILILLFTLLFIIPGFIKHYELFFVEFIAADKPGLTTGQVNELSKKLTNDHKGELFKLDLSFIGWFLLCLVSCGIGLIYVVPYYTTVKALYYQNFKARCIQEMKITELDYMTDEERTQAYNQNQNGYNQYQNGYVQNPNGGYNYYQANSNTPNYGSYQPQGSYNSNSSFDPRFNQNQPNTPYNQPKSDYQGNTYNNSNVAPIKDFADVELKFRATNLPIDYEDKQ